MNEAFTWPSVQRDFREWHRGRRQFSVWAIRLETAGTAIDQRLGQVRAALQPLLLPGYARQPHITLHICGFPAPALQRADDFDRQQLQAQIDAVAGLRLAPLTLHIGGAFSFASAACLAVQDDHQALQRLRRVWQQAAPGADATPYVPHVTAGLYGGAWPLAAVQARLAPLVTLPTIRVQVQALDWMVYDSRHIAGPLCTLLRLDLATGQAQVPDAAALDTAFSTSSSTP